MKEKPRLGYWLFGNFIFKQQVIPDKTKILSRLEILFMSCFYNRSPIWRIAFYVFARILRVEYTSRFYFKSVFAGLREVLGLMKLKWIRGF